MFIIYRRLLQLVRFAEISPPDPRVSICKSASMRNAILAVNRNGLQKWKLRAGRGSKFTRSEAPESLNGDISKVRLLPAKIHFSGAGDLFRPQG
jgi:hypothetical protein